MGAALLGSTPTPFREGPPPAHTGGFGEPTCQACHLGAELNEPPGGLSLDGVPAEYVPGRVYALRVVVHRPGLAAAGFQLAARFAGGPADGRQAGALRALDSLAEVVSDPTGLPAAVQYAQHTSAGAKPAASDTGRWALEWTAPARDGVGVAGSIVFHVAANAANDDASPLGDFIQTTSRATRPAPAPR